MSTESKTYANTWLIPLDFSFNISFYPLQSEEYKSQRTLEEFTKFAERLSSAEQQTAKLSKDGMVPDLKDDAETVSLKDLM